MNNFTQNTTENNKQIQPICQKKLVTDKLEPMIGFEPMAY